VFYITCNHAFTVTYCRDRTTVCLSVCLCVCVCV